MDIPTDIIREYIPKSLKQFTSYAIITDKIILSVFIEGWNKIIINVITNHDKIILSVY
jgi:hypothetical protein